MELIVKVKLLNELAKSPAYAKPGDAGADLYATEKLSLGPGMSGMVKTGLSIELSEGYEAQIRPRSGLAYKQQITVLNTPGTIDEGYRGEIGVILINHSDGWKHIEIGDRIAQMVIKPVKQATFVVVDELSDTDRGKGGFGSTGVKEADKKEDQTSPNTTLHEDEQADAEGFNKVRKVTADTYIDFFTRTNLKPDRRPSKDMLLGMRCVGDGLIEGILIERVAAAIELFNQPEEPIEQAYVIDTLRATLERFDTTGNLLIIPIDEDTEVHCKKDGNYEVVSKQQVAVEPELVVESDTVRVEVIDKTEHHVPQAPSVAEVEADANLTEGGIAVLKVDEATGEATPTGMKLDTDITVDDETKELMKEAASMQDEDEVISQASHVLNNSQTITERDAKGETPFNVELAIKHAVEMLKEADIKVTVDDIVTMVEEGVSRLLVHECGDILEVVEDSEEIAEATEEEPPETATTTGIPQAPPIPEDAPTPAIDGFSPEEIAALVEKYGKDIKKAIDVYTCNDDAAEKYLELIEHVDEETFIQLIAQSIELKDRAGEDVVIVELLSTAVIATLDIHDDSAGKF